MDWYDSSISSQSSYPVKPVVAQQTSDGHMFHPQAICPRKVLKREELKDKTVLQPGELLHCFRSSKTLSIRGYYHHGFLLEIFSVLFSRSEGVGCPLRRRLIIMTVNAVPTSVNAVAPPRHARFPRSLQHKLGVETLRSLEFCPQEFLPSVTTGRTCSTHGSAQARALKGLAMPWPTMTIVRGRWVIDYLTTKYRV